MKTVGLCLEIAVLSVILLCGIGCRRTGEVIDQYGKNRIFSTRSKEAGSDEPRRMIWFSGQEYPCDIQHLSAYICMKHPDSFDSALEVVSEFVALHNADETHMIESLADIPGYEKRPLPDDLGGIRVGTHAKVTDEKNGMCEREPVPPDATRDGVILLQEENTLVEPDRGLTIVVYTYTPRLGLLKRYSFAITRPNRLARRWTGDFFKCCSCMTIGEGIGDFP